MISLLRNIRLTLTRLCLLETAYQHVGKREFTFVIRSVFPEIGKFFEALFWQGILFLPNRRSAYISHSFHCFLGQYRLSYKKPGFFKKTFRR